MAKGVYPRTDFHAQRIKEGRNQAFYRHSEETKRKISVAIKNLWLLKNPDVKKGNAEETLQTET